MISSVSVLLASALIVPTKIVPWSISSQASIAQPSLTEQIASPALDLEWTAPEGCPDGSAVRRDVARMVGDTPAGGRHLKVVGAIVPGSDGGWSLNLKTDLDGVAGERILSGASCTSLSDAAAVTLALILNPEFAAPPVVEETAAEPAPTVVKPEAPSPAASPEVSLGVLAGIESGRLTQSSSFFGLALDVALGRMSVRLIPGFSPSQDIHVAASSTAGGRLWLASLAGLGCADVGTEKVSLRPCLGLDLTRLHGHGFGVLRSREATVYWTSADLAVFAGVKLGTRVRMEVGGFASRPLHRPTVYLDEQGPVSRPAAWGFRAVAGVAWQF